MNHHQTLWIVIVIIGLATQPALSQHGGHGAHPLMPDQKLMVECKLLNTENYAPLRVEAKLRDRNLPATLSQEIALPWLNEKLELTDYLPLAQLDQTVIETDETGEPAIFISIDGPTQSYQRWLMANVQERNRLVSFIGTWRFMAVKDTSQRDYLWEQFRTEYTRDPLLHVNGPDGLHRQQLPAAIGRKKELKGLDYSLEVLSFMPHFSMDEKTKQPRNQSQLRRNPAVMVRITGSGRQEDRWVFSKFPAYTSESTDRLPIEVTLDCPVQSTSQAPDYVIVTTGKNDLELWSRHQGKTDEQTLTINQPIDIAGSQYRFQLGQSIPHGKLVERYVSSDKPGAVPALRIASKLIIGLTSPLWIALNERRVVNTKAGPMAITFMTSSAVPKGGHH